MIRDDRAQISLEYLLIFTISLIVIIVFTLPLTEEAIKDTMDVNDALCAKSDLSKISHAIKIVYGQGQGSKQIIRLHVTKDIRINIGNDYVSSNIKLKDNSDKRIVEHVDSNIKQTSFFLDKGENIIIVEWPQDSENMIIYKKLF
ncbi:class III signal peptide-containing protein [Methanobrevibacter sp.]